MGRCIGSIQNAGPRLLIAFSADNADVKFPHRLPITMASHETYIYDVRRANCVSSTSTNQQNFDLHKFRRIGCSVLPNIFLVNGVIADFKHPGVGTLKHPLQGFIQELSESP